MSKTSSGDYFEDFRIGQVIAHATPRTVTSGDRALYGALYPTRFALSSSDVFAAASGLSPAPVEELIGFHIAFGKTVPDVSLNAVANLGYAECRFHRPVRPGDTVSASAGVVGLKGICKGRSGVVWVRSTARNQHGETVIDWARWVMVRKRRIDAPAPAPVSPAHAPAVAARALILPAGLEFSGDAVVAARAPHRRADDAEGE
ncbi:MAG: MaoC family dehydratase, partial [Pikeienuella sp.]